MGLDINAVQFLMAAQKRGAKFGQVLTLGRQDLNVFPARMCKLLRSHGLADESFRPDATDSLFAEPVFKAPGATQVVSMDVSDFEGAMFIHDLQIGSRSDPSSGAPDEHRSPTPRFVTSFLAGSKFFAHD